MLQVPGNNVLTNNRKQKKTADHYFCDKLTRAKVRNDIN